MPQVRSCTADFEVGAREQGVTGRNIPEPLGASHHVKSAAQFAAHLRLLWLQKNSLIRGSEG